MINEQFQNETNLGHISISQTFQDKKKKIDEINILVDDLKGIRNQLQYQEKIVEKQI